ncbi:MAG: S41 family peptidase [Saprospiraceae bacterium]|nr:S41 family peptidase [Saprospiraceae bacterium]
MKNIIFGLLAIFLLSSLSCSEEYNKIDGLKAFSKVYGYVKYFHPSEEAAQLDWNYFASYGAKEIEKCGNKDELVVTLKELFKPIAPGIVFLEKESPYDFNAITPKDTSQYEVTYWQHLGVAKDMNYNYGIYKSIRVNSSSIVEGNEDVKSIKWDAIFDEHPSFGELIEAEIVPGVFCQIPMVLYNLDEQTFPKSELFKSFHDKVKKADRKPESRAMRLGNVINIYNVFHHFYPYFDVLDLDWESEFVKALTQSRKDSTDIDHLVTLEKFTSPLKDGHLWVKGPKTGAYQPPVNWEFVEGQLVITEILSDSIEVNLGDVVTKIDNVPVDDYFDEVKSTISAGTEGWANYIAYGKSMFGKKDTPITIEIEGKKITLYRDGKYTFGVAKIPIQAHRYKKLDHNIYYLNLSTIEMDTITTLLPELETAKGIICDMRGYPNGNHGLISHLMKENDTTKGWMKIPKVIRPDQKGNPGYQDEDWGLEAKEPYLGDKKVVFLIDGRAISYAESYMGYIEGYDLATIVGQPTAGTNGNLNSFNLLGGYAISWTGMKVLKHNGSQHHAVGIVPDIVVNRTIEGVKTGKDEYLEKAIELILE